MRAIFILSIGILVLLPSDAREVTTCLANDTNPYLSLATKTSYDYIHSLRSSINANNLVGCKPVKIWVLFRHGTRFPDIRDMEDFQNLPKFRDEVISNHETRFNGHLCDKDLENLKAWTYTVESGKEDQLAPQGYKDLSFIAKRLKTQFAEILNTSYSQDKFVFMHSNTERTQRSTEAFVEGLFGKDAGVYIPDASPEVDRALLRPYDNCTKWQEKSKGMKEEANNFAKTDLMSSLRASVSNRLGFKYNLTNDMIVTLYDICRFDKAWEYTKISPWCAAFNKEELMLMEYYEDLKYYYKSSYGNSMNLQLGCPLLSDLYEKFSEAENSSISGSIGTFYFSHASMLNMFNARLGLDKDDEPPTHKNYETMGKRKFRTTFLLPFATNIAAVFYKCSGDDENQVMFYHNEKVIPYEGCNVGLCSWKMIKDKFTPTVNPSTCNVDLCKANSGASILNLSMLVFGVVAVLVLRL